MGLFRNEAAAPPPEYPATQPYPDPAAGAPPPAPRFLGWKRLAYVFGALLALLFLWLLVTAPLSNSLKPIAAPGITLVSANGKPIARSGAVTDRPVDVTKLPDHVGQAFLAIEDRRFYNHAGIDPWGIGRAAFRNLTAGGVREGGSTITQQLAKLAFLSSDRTAARKIQEVILAFWLEAWLSKDEILSRYLSSVYFGDNVYGLRAAAHHYFSRDPQELTVEQSAMLAGLLKAPSRLAPTRNLKGARDRARIVVATMVEAGFLTRAEADALPVPRLKVASATDLPTGTYFADWVFPQAREQTELDYGDQKVVTTLDDRLQKNAVDAIRRASLAGAQVALVAMRPNGEVVAMIGGKSYKASPFNRAVQARRQPGSTFKLFVYLAALRAGMTPDSIVSDEPLTIGSWSPRNSGERYRGPITLSEAFAVSSNVAAVRISEQVGRENVIQAARDLGVSSPLADDPSLALGTSGTTLLEMTAAYAAVASGRPPVRARGLPQEADEGWVGAVRNRIRNFRERSTWPMMLDMLHAAAHEGTGRAAALPVDTFGKTGTSQDYRDAIFIGFAGDLVTGVWIGNDNNSPLKGVQGGGLPARIWRDFMSRSVEGGMPARRAAPPPEEIDEADVPIISLELPSMVMPLNDIGMEVGIGIEPDGVVIDARPSAPPPEPPVSRPTEAAAPPPREGE